MEQSGLAISSGIDTGWAQTFGRSTFDPVKFMDDLAAEKKAADIAAAKAKADRALRNRKFMLELKPKDVNQWNQPKIEEEMNRFQSKMDELSAQGIDLETDPEARKALNEGRVQMLNLKSMGDQIQNTVEAYRKQLAENPDELDYEELQDWEKKLEELPTIEERASFIRTNTPFIPKFNEVEFLTDVVESTPLETLQKGLTVYREQGEDEAKKILFANLESQLLDPAKRRQVESQMDVLVKAGKIQNPTVEEYEEYLLKNLIPRLEQSETKKAAPKAKGGGGQTKPEAGGLVASKIDQTGMSDYGGVNKLAFTKDSPSVTLFDNAGNPSFSKIEAITRKKDTDDKDKWFVEGREATPKTGAQIEKEAKAAGMKYEDFLTQNEYVQKENGDYVSFKFTKPFRFIVSDKPGAMGHTNYQVLTGIIGENLYDYVERKNKEMGLKTEAGGKKSGGKITTLAEIKGLVGKRGYENYSEKELIEYYKSQGYTIK